MKFDAKFSKKLFFFSLNRKAGRGFIPRKVEKANVKQCLECAAPKIWSKYTSVSLQTSPYFKTVSRPIIVSSCFPTFL